MKCLSKLLFICLLLSSSIAIAQCPQNIGFEDGTFNGWKCYAGTIDKTNGDITVASTTPISGRHTIFSGDYAGVDPYGGFPVLCPNGSNYSIRLGNSESGGEAERVTYEFTVPAGSEYTLIFNYAVVLQNPSDHAAFEQPRFTVKIFDDNNMPIDCPQFDFVAASNLPGFKLSTMVDPVTRGVPASVYYKEWSKSTINLVGYAGKTIRLEFTTNDCSRGGHFGYAYIDVEQQCGDAITGNAYCIGQPSVTLYAPAGFYTYTWYKEDDMTTPIGTGPNLTISPAPPDGSKYAVVILPFPDQGCLNILHTVVSQINSGFTFKVANTLHGCPETGVDLTAATVTTGSDPDLSLSYFTDPVTLAYLYTPKKILTSGVYYIRAVNSEGCMNILPVSVIISEPTVTITDPSPVQYPAKVDLSTAFTPVAGLSYSYYSDAAGSNQIDKKVSITGIYYVKVTDNTPCSTLSPVHVVITPPPPYTVTAPNTFTPNNDGINDHFFLTITGYAVFGNLRIFNRYGQLLFTAKSASEYWDGNFNGKNVPAGTYYWVFEGQDGYYNTKISKAASITLLR